MFDQAPLAGVKQAPSFQPQLSKTHNKSQLFKLDITCDGQEIYHDCLGFISKIIC